MSDTLHTLKVIIEANTSKFKKATSEIMGQTKKMVSSVNAQTKGIKGVDIANGKEMSQIRNIQKKFKDMVKQFQVKAGIKVETDDYKKVKQDIESAEKVLDRYYEKRDKMEALGTARESSSWKSLEYDIKNAERQLERYYANKKQMESSGSDVKRQYGMKDVSKALFSKVFSGMKSVLSKITPAIKKSGGAFASLIQKFKSGIPHIGKAKSSLNGFGRSCRGIGGILNSIGMTARFMFASFVVRGTLDGAKKGFQNLAQYSDQTNASLSMLMSSLTQLKNALAAAFAPILDVIAPILNFLIQKVISVVNVFGQLMSSLTGKGSYVRAKNVQQDYAASIADTSSSMKDSAKNTDKAAKANEKYQKTILGFDEINKLDDNSASDSSYDTPDTSLGGLSPADMFETVPINSNIKNFADRLKEAWKNADFTEIGAIFGNKLNEALESIPWDKIKSTLRKIAKSIATFLNGFIETADWRLVGNTLAQGVNTAFEFVDSFARNFHWDSLGNAIGNGINGALNGLDWNVINSACTGISGGIAATLNNALYSTDWKLTGVSFGKGVNTIINTAYSFVTTFDWKKFGLSISEGINGAVSTIDFGKGARAFSEVIKGLLDIFIQAVENTDWKMVGEKVREFLVNIDWKGIVGKLCEAIGAAFGGLGAFIGGLIGDGITNAKKYFQEKIEECGGDVVLGILKGIKDAIVGVGKWIYDNVFTPIIKGFKSAFGIHSPSTVMSEQGRYIIAGLLDGVKNSVGSVLTWFGELPGRIREVAGNAKEWIKEKGRGAIEGLKNGYESVKESMFLSKVRRLKDNTFDAIGNMAGRVKSKGSDITKGMKAGLTGTFSQVISWVSNIPDKIANGIGSLWDVGRNAIQSLADGFSSVHIPMPHIGWDWNEISLGNFSFSVPSFNLNWYAKGGFPQNGEMFIANEAGPEMIGKLGNRNVVANNKQIAEGIKDAVIDGMMQVFMATNFGHSEQKDVVLEFTFKSDSETIYKIVRKGKKKHDGRYEVVDTF